MCPRCGDVLERVLQGVLTCTRCEGVWLANAMIDQAFGTQRWPGGASAWWRRALECPACACNGAASAMTPMLVGDRLVVDRCAAHGVWLDHGELGRLLGAPNVVELEAFHERLKPGAELPPQLIAQRKRREAELTRRQQELDDYRKQLAAERERIEAETRAERARLAAEKRAEEERIAAEHRAAERKRLGALRAMVERDADARAKELVTLREQVRAAEGKLADARGKLLEIDRQLDAVGRR